MRIKNLLSAQVTVTDPSLPPFEPLEERDVDEETGLKLLSNEAFMKVEAHKTSPKKKAEDIL